MKNQIENLCKGGNEIDETNEKNFVLTVKRGICFQLNSEGLLTKEQLDRLLDEIN